MQVNRFGPEDGSPVLLLHGGGVAGWMWDSLRQSLERTRAVLVPDLPGHGASAGEPYLSHGETVDELAQVLAQHGRGAAAVIGFSLGAQLTVELASRHGELVDRAMVVSAQARAMPFSGLTLRALAMAAPLARRRWFARLQARELFIPPQLLEQYIETSAGITRETLLAAVGHNLRFELPREWADFRGAALVMVGSRERHLMRDSAAAIHAALPGSELEVVAGCGHGVPLQRPEWFNARVADWLSALEPSSTPGG
jgi:pimeloyl-ACP methyl ester carboxylesterase